MEEVNATLSEIRGQTEAWKEAITVVKDHQKEIQNIDFNQYQQAIFLGCGSTYYLSLSAASLFQQFTGIYSKGLPSSEVLLNPRSVNINQSDKTIFCAVSRSGTTSETLKSVETLKKKGQGDVITITNYPESPLARMGRVNLSLPAGREVSVAQTKSFASMFVASTVLGLIVGNQLEHLAALSQLIPAGERIIQEYEELAQKMGGNHEIERFFFLGSGYQYGLASEASLKMKEMSLSVSEPFHFLEFRHGPISMVDKNTLVVGLISEERREYEEAVLKDIKKLGGRVLIVGEKNADVEFHSDLPESMKGVLYLPFLQLLAYYRAVSRGLNPDQPRNLTAVVELWFP